MDPKKENSYSAPALTKEIISDLVDLLYARKTPGEITQVIGGRPVTLYTWLARALLDPPKIRTTELDLLREAIFDFLLSETILKHTVEMAVKSANPQPKISEKTVTLHVVPKTDLTMLEKMGEIDFLREVENGGVVIKRERSEESAPQPNLDLIKELLKKVDKREDVEGALKLYIEFPKTDPRLPEV